MEKKERKRKGNKRMEWMNGEAVRKLSYEHGAMNENKL
jgi:hypothetical protein